MKYCNNCLMPDTRPGIKFVKGVCLPCINYEKQKDTDWSKRKKHLEKICRRYRKKNGDGYDCAIAVSGGKDSHFQVYYMKEVMKMNPILFTAGNIEWTETGRKNLENLSDTFSCDIIEFHPNIDVARKMALKSFKEIGQPNWYIDSLMYHFPIKMAMKFNIKLLVYGEDVNYTYGGKYDKETPDATYQLKNDAIKPIWNDMLKNNSITSYQLESAKPPSINEMKKFGLEMIYLSYFVPWNSHHNYEVARKWGFQHLDHEYLREGTIEGYNQIDSISYLLGQFLKYPKFAHSAATEMASRWIRYGMRTREEMIPVVQQEDSKLDQEIVNRFCSFTKISPKEFWKILDKWYNKDYFTKDSDGVWKPKFKVGVNT